MQRPLFHQSTQYHVVVRSKACEKRVWAYSLVWTSLIPPVDTAPQQCWSDRKAVRKDAGRG